MTSPLELAATPKVAPDHVNCLCTPTPACVVCGRHHPDEGTEWAGTGWWAYVEGCDPVCGGPCWRAYVEAQAVRSELAKWAHLYPGTVFEATA